MVANRWTKPAIAVACTLATVALYGVAWMVLNYFGNQVPPTDALLRVDEIGGEFTLLGERTASQGLAVSASRHFALESETLMADRSWIRNSAQRSPLGPLMEVDQWVDLYLQGVVATGWTEGSVVSTGGPDLGRPTAWRKIISPSGQPSANWLVVAFTHRTTNTLIMVRYARLEPRTDDLLRMAKQVISRLEQEHSGG
jgi:hypothetical protein